MIWVLAKQWKMKANKGPLVYKLVMIVLQLLQALGRPHDMIYTNVKIVIAILKSIGPGNRTHCNQPI